MKKPESLIELLVLPLHKIDFKPLGFEYDKLVAFTESSDFNYHEILDHTSVLRQLSVLKNKIGISDIAFISKGDHFDFKVLAKEINYIFKSGLHRDLTLLVPYLPPPSVSQRNDGKVRSALASSKLLPDTVFHLNKFWRMLYDLTYTYLNSPESQNIEIFQVGKPKLPADKTDTQLPDLLKRSLLIVPHKGSVKLLKRCLSHLNLIQDLPDSNICFDDESYKKIDNVEFVNLKPRLTSFLNNPGNVGPYLPRHYSILNSNKEFIFFQDSDDIPVNSRFFKQLSELKKRKLDIIGSHELRVDQFAKSLIIFRYPLEVIKTDSAYFLNPLFHPTSLITKRAYLKAKGFSTNIRFGYDYQFLLRACFILKMGNIDDFLYIRFKRPNSLTTKASTKLGSSVRAFLNWRWRIDYKLVNENKLDLDNSSLAVQKHQFDYQLIKLTG